MRGGHPSKNPEKQKKIRGALSLQVDLQGWGLDAMDGKRIGAAMILNTTVTTLSLGGALLSLPCTIVVAPAVERPT